jgi:hypothetical protein
MAGDAPKRKAMSDKAITDWLSKPYPSCTAHVEKHRRLFVAFNEFVTREGGAVVSPPGDKLVRVECPEGSSLPIRLAELGYKLNFLSPGTRNTASGIIPVDIIELKLSVR